MDTEYLHILLEMVENNMTDNLVDGKYYKIEKAEHQPAGRTHHILYEQTGDKHKVR